MPNSVKFLPTYRLGPSKPFNREVCEKILKRVMDEQLENFIYSSSGASNMCQQISMEIVARMKNQKQDRYRYICIVTIGERNKQGYNAVVKFLWDAEKDIYVSYVYDRPNLFAVATIYALYFD